MQYPSTQEITHIVRNRVVDPSTFRARSFCPITPEYVLDIQYDVLAPSYGMTRAHNVGSNPATTNVPVMSTQRFGTAYWKETLTLNEKELLYARNAGSYHQRAGRDLVVQRALHLDTRLETRLEWLPWQVLVAGQIAINDNNVSYTVTYGLPAANKPDLSGDSANKWSAATCNPVDNINDWVALYRGSGAKPKTVFMNQITAKYLTRSTAIQNLLKNTIYVKNLGVTQMPDVLKMLIPNLDFEIYDGGYLDETKTFQPFIPDGRVCMIGDYTGEKMMDFVSTISLHNGGIDKPAPGKFAIVEDESQNKKNPHIDITTGIYGLPRVFHPEWIVSAKVF